LIRTLTTLDVSFVIQKISTSIHEKLAYLTELDSILGDGDHGSNLDRGFGEVRKRLAGFSNNDIGTLFEITGSTLLASVGGASGPLYGTIFQKAGRVCKGQTEIGIKEVALLLQNAEKGIVTLGGASVGDKTMLDSLHPAAEAAKEASEKEYDLVRAFELISSRSEEGLEATKNLVSRKGRASYLGERAKGHYDVGAASFCIIVRSILGSLRELDERRIFLFKS
jgi:dihydroxyacetone kinase-like protein